MVFIATTDPDLGRRLLEAIEGRKVVFVQEVDATELRHKIHQTQPEVVVLDVRFGGNRYRVIDEAPAIMLCNSGPAVILLSPWDDDRVIDHAGTNECFDVISLSRPSFGLEVSRSVLDAKAARLSGALERPRRPARGALH